MRKMFKKLNAVLFFQQKGDEMNKSRLIEIFGTPSEVARVLGTDRAVVANWPEELHDKAIGRLFRVRPDVAIRLWSEQEAKKKAA